MADPKPNISGQPSQSIPPQPPLKASPNKRNHTATHYSAIAQQLAEEQRKGHRLSMDGKIVVVDYDTMMKDHVPCTKDDPDDSYFESFTFKGKAATESKFYKPFTKAVNNGWLKGTKFKVVVTSATSDPSDPSKQRVDLAIYATDSAPGEGDPANWSAIELTIEVKLQEASEDPIDDNTVNFQPMSDDRKKNLGQVLSYSSLVFEHQQRTHHFTVVILGRCARIIRWDRAGALVSEKFDYVENPWMLGRFLWRFAHMSATQRGHDTTATRVLTSSPEYRLMRERADVPQKNAEGSVVNEHARMLFRASVSNSSTQWWKLRVDDSAGPRFFLVGKPHFQASGLAGRGTRGYVSVDLENPYGALVFVKDAWRVAHEGIQREGHILRYLNEKKVERVPTLLCHGDVRTRIDDRLVEDDGEDFIGEEEHETEEEEEDDDEDEDAASNDGERPRGKIQQTVSQKYWAARKPGAHCSMKTHRHYRIVVQEVGLPMSHFKDAKELVFLLAKGMKTHEQAYNAGILHRDISAGNVLIHIKEFVRNGVLVRSRDMLLTDWELSKRLDQSEMDPRQPDRTGTWQFMSANSLTDPWRVIGVEDEMESFFHLLLFYAIRYLPNNCDGIGAFMENYFDGFTKENGQYFCGPMKLAAMTSGSITLPNGAVQLTFYLPSPSEPQNESGEANSAESGAAIERQLHPINSLISSMLKWFQARYALLNQQQNPRDVPSTRMEEAEETDEGPTEEELWFMDQDNLDLTPSAHEQTTISPEELKKLEEEAANLKEHRCVIRLFGHVCTGQNAKAWRRDDKIPDQLRPNFRPDKDDGEPVPPLGSKRASLPHNEDEHGDVEIPIPPPPKRRSSRKLKQS